MQTTQLIEDSESEIAQLFAPKGEPEADRGADSAQLAPITLLDRNGNAVTLETRGILTRGIKKRRSSGIHGYVGLNGQFKSFAMVRDTLPDLAQGRKVLSTVALLDPFTGNPHPNYVPLRAWEQLFEHRNGPVLFDEVTGLMDSRDAGMPKRVRRFLPQMRRANSPIRWTGIDFDNSDRRLRQITAAVTQCRGFVPTNAALTPGTADTLAMWRPNRLAYLTTYDAQTLKKSDDSAAITEDRDKKRRARVLNREWVWAPGSLTFDTYDTLAPVDGVDNSCPACGGRIPEKVHSDAKCDGVPEVGLSTLHLH